jgi:CTP synthase (UTP-ammonia lyase)
VQASGHTQGRLVADCDSFDFAQTELHIAIVGKYNGLSDAYLSVIKALQHACIKCKSRLKVRLLHLMLLRVAACAAVHTRICCCRACACLPTFASSVA